MPERGGATTQSGILFQNSITALYLGRLLDPAERKGSERVIAVRAEAPSIVDDIVVEFADQHTDYIQAKESVAAAEWTSVWRDFLAQYRSASFRHGKDRLVLICGHEPTRVAEAAEACSRAFASPTPGEWIGRLSERGRGVVQDVGDRIGFSVEPELHSLFQHVTIEVMSLRAIERDRTYFWIPQNSCGVMQLFRVLRDKVGGHARTRITFDRERLIRELAEEIPSFRIETVVAFAEIERSVKRCNALLDQHKATLGNTEIHCQRTIVRSIVDWMTSQEANGRVAMLLDHAGAGKTVVVTDVAATLEEAGQQVIALKADIQLAGVDSAEELQTRLQLPDTFERVVERMSVKGPVFVLFDQIDALSLALAHNEQTLSVVLDLLARVVSIDGVRVLLSCRTFDRNNDPRLRQFRSARTFAIPLLDDDELRYILRTGGIDLMTIARPTRELIRLPLHMDLFLLTHRSGKAPVTLQDLYRSLIHQVALQAAPGAPSRATRAAVLAKLTAYMHEHHRTSAPDKELDEDDHRAAEWLASHDILRRTENGWTFRHQTMLEYLFADDFVEQGRSLVGHLTRSAQGLPQRTELLQILPHLRAEQPAALVGQISAICSSKEIRFHLRDLAMRWFAALKDPTADEKAWVARLVDVPAVRRRFWLAARGNPVWMDELREHLDDTILHEDELAAEEVITYVGSVAQERQAATIEILTDLARARDHSANAIAAVLRRIEWNDPCAIDLFALLAERGVPLPHERFTAALIELDPARAARWIAATARRSLAFAAAAADRAPAGVPASGEATKDLEPAVVKVSASAPEAWLKAIVPAFDELLTGSAADLPSEPSESGDSFSRSLEIEKAWASFVSHFQEFSLSDIRSIVDSIGVALLGLRSREEFIRWVSVIGRTRSVCLQDELARTLAKALSSMWTIHLSGMLSAEFVKLAADFIGSPHRKLDGSSGGLLALVRALAPHDSDRRIRKTMRREIESQTELRIKLRSFWTETLTARPSRRKKPAAENRPDVEEKDPAPADDEQKPVTREQWRRAIHRRRIPDNDANRLALRLRMDVAQDPEWFLRTFADARGPIAGPFVRALFQGLEQTSIPLSDVHSILPKLLRPPLSAGVPCSVAWWLARRAEPVPDDLLALLEQWAREPALESTATRDSLMANRASRSYYLGSDRGAPFLILMRALRTQQGPDGATRRAELFEYVARDGTCVLKAAAIDELIYELPAHPTRVFDWLDRFFLDDEADLLYAARLVPLLEAALRHSFSRISRYIIDLYDEYAFGAFEAGASESRARGAQLLAHAAVLSLTSPKTELIVARRLFEYGLGTGQSEHKRAAARVLTAAIDRGPVGEYCVAMLRRLLDDPDPTVRTTVAQSFAHFGRWDLNNRYDFFFAYARSRALVEGIGAFATLLLDHGLSLPDLSLSLIEAMLANKHLRDAPRGYLGQELIQFVIRVELFPASTSDQRRRDMDAFDLLMEHYADVAGEVLADWDRQ